MGSKTKQKYEALEKKIENLTGALKRKERKLRKTRQALKEVLDFAVGYSGFLRHASYDSWARISRGKDV